jgi:hypothetical protein
VAMQIGSISPRVVALSLGVAATMGLVAGGSGLTTRSTPPADGSTSAPTSRAADHNKPKKHGSPTTADSGATAPVDASVSRKTDKPGSQEPKKAKKHPIAADTASVIPRTSLTPSPSASAPASSTPPPSEPVATTEAAAVVTTEPATG